MIYKIKRYIFALTHPNYWLQNYTYNSALDEIINSLNWDEVEIESRYHALIDGRRFWVASHPYSSFEVCDEQPSRLTRHKLMKVINMTKGKQKAEERAKAHNQLMMK